jgi:peptidoglycan/xylan/chitin deacetylase (PgdA/CDA1 family)
MLITHKINIILFIILTVLLGTSAFLYDTSLWWLLVPFVLYVTLAAIGSGLVWTGYHIKAYCKNPAISHNMIAISFDDGPTPYTLKVLDLLNLYNAKATFFCIGKQIEMHPDIFKKIIEEGHTVGNHTYTHQPKFPMFSKHAIIKELKVTNEMIQLHSGMVAKFFRPPYGVTSPKMAKAITDTGYTVIGWNIRSLDAVIKDENKIVNRIKKRLKPGSIILLHDTSQKTVNVLEQLLVLLQQDNYKMVTVDHLLNIPAYEN